MTALAPDRLTLPELGWELHRPRRGARATAVGYFGDYECVRVTGPLLHLRVAVWTRILQRRIAATRGPVS